MIHPSSFVHPTAIIEKNVEIFENVKIWHFTHVREGARLAAQVSLARDVYVDTDVHLGKGTRVQNGVSIFHGVDVGEWCFIGPHAIFTNDPCPRIGKKNWKLERTTLQDGMSIGAGAIIRCGVTIGSFAMIGAGALVTKDIPPFALAMGLPAEVEFRICACGDTRLPPTTCGDALILDCCRTSLDPEVLLCAEAAAMKTTPIHQSNC